LIFTTNRPPLNSSEEKQEKQLNEQSKKWDSWEISKGNYAVSNGFWNDFCWPKTKFLQNNLEKILNERIEQKETESTQAQNANQFQKNKTFRTICFSFGCNSKFSPRNTSTFQNPLE